MSWIEDMGLDIVMDDYYEKKYIDNIKSKLSDNSLENLYNNLEKDYFFLIASILKKFKEGYKLTDKQKKCIALYVEKHDLEKLLEE